MANTYDVGDLIRCTGTFTNAAGTAIDPATVYFKYKDPGGTKTTLTYGVDAAVVKSSTGVYYVDVNVDEVGTWYYRWQATGTGQSAGESYFYAQAPRL
jgi:hypothetical protein